METYLLSEANIPPGSTALANPTQIVGSLTFLWGFVILRYLPDGPHNAKMLTEYERMVAVWRVSKNQMGLKHHAIIWSQVGEAFTDGRTYILMLMGACTGILNGSVANFASSLIKGFGFDALRTSLLQTPGGAFEVLGCWFFGWMSTHKNLVGVTIIGMKPPCNSLSLHNLAESSQCLVYQVLLD